MQTISRRQLSFGSLMIAAPKISAFEPPLSVVVTGAHPGDPEYGCGGTIARYAESGHRVAIVYLNRGDKGCGSRSSDECAAVRTGEAERACQILNARPVFAAQRDGDAVVDAPHTDAFCKLIGAQAPDVLFTHWPLDNHPDHRATYLLAYSAWQRFRKRFAFYFYEVSDGDDTVMFSPTDYVDISRVETRKRAACYAHASQAPDKFYALQSKITAFRGVESGYAQAEAFARHAQSVGGLLP
jgi:LmbE family N-acetylglucosaminyl deacetylase